MSCVLYYVFLIALDCVASPVDILLEQFDVQKLVPCTLVRRFQNVCHWRSWVQTLKKEVHLARNFKQPHECHVSEELKALIQNCEEFNSRSVANKIRTLLTKTFFPEMILIMSKFGIKLSRSNMPLGRLKRKNKLLPSTIDQQNISKPATVIHVHIPANSVDILDNEQEVDYYAANSELGWLTLQVSWDSCCRVPHPVLVWRGKWNS